MKVLDIYIGNRLMEYVLTVQILHTGYRRAKDFSALVVNADTELH